MPKQPRSAGDSALHTLLRNGASVEELRTLVESHDGDRSEFVNRKNQLGITALMLAAGCGGPIDVEAVHFLLANGAAKEAHAHSKTRRSAATYALEHGNAQLAEELRRVEEAQLALLTNSSSNGMASSRCAVCGDRISRVSKFQSVYAAVNRGDETNPLIVDFVRSSPCSLSPLRPSQPPQPHWLEPLCRPALHSMTNRKGFTRELTEALAMVARLRRIVGRSSGSGRGMGSGPRGGDDDDVGSGDEESAEEESAEKESAEEESAESGPWHVIDLCAGKGFLATLLAVLYPRMMVTAVDKFEPTFLPHYEAAGIDNVRYAQLDVLAPNFVQALRTVIRTDGAGRRTIVLGMHLCGLLSLRAAELIRSLPEVEAVVLAPCCLPGAHQAEDTPREVFAAESQALQYRRWCRFVERKLREAARGASSRERGERVDKGGEGGGGGEGRGGDADSERLCVEVDVEVEAEADGEGTQGAEVVVEEEPALVSCKNTLLTCMRKRQPPMRSAPQDNGADGVGNDKNSKGHHVSAPPPPPPQSVPVLAPASEGGDASSSAAAEPLPPVPAGFFALDPAACSRLHGARLASTTSSACGERLSVAGRPVAVFAVRGELFAIDAECPHQGASLEVGDIEESPTRGPCVSCPRHGWSIELKTGYCEDIDDVGLRTYEVRTLRHGQICVGTQPK